MDCGHETIRRTIWDGAQELAEIQMPGGDSVSNATLENDTLPLANRGGVLAENGEYKDLNGFFGRVAYTHGVGLDRPLSVVRFDYADSVVNRPFVRWAPFSLVPHWNLRGEADNGSFSDGALTKCTTAGGDLTTTGTIGALTIRGAAQAGSKIIEMAWGTPIKYDAIKDEIQFWYYNGNNRLFVGAGGTYHPCFFTNSNNVLFPAELPEVIAVSPANWDGSKPCSAGYGPELDLVAMHNQPTTGPADWGGALASTGESSNASAVVAGIAALVWQRFPAFSNLQVRGRLLSTAGTANCGAPQSWHLLVNAEAAVGGLCVEGGRIIGVDNVTFNTPGGPADQTLVYQVNVTGGDGPLQFQWATGQTTSYVSYTLPRGDYSVTVSVTIRDAGSTAPPIRLYKTVSVHDYCDDPGVDPTAIYCG